MGNTIQLYCKWSDVMSTSAVKDLEFLLCNSLTMVDALSRSPGFWDKTLVCESLQSHFWWLLTRLIDSDAIRGTSSPGTIVLGLDEEALYGPNVLLLYLLTPGFQNTVRTVATGCVVDTFRDIDSRTTVTPIDILISGTYPTDRSVASAYFPPFYILVTLSVCENKRERARERVGRYLR